MTLKIGLDICGDEENEFETEINLKVLLAKVIGVTATVTSALIAVVLRMI
jgi:hypothetical protein